MSFSMFFKGALAVKVMPTFFFSQSFNGMGIYINDFNKNIYFVHKEEKINKTTFNR